ncbi:MAG: 30S ribosome-binding factor RbfA [bacterium]|nr:30S ribosome-binding factor RbfA [Candidatus Kapabacteria bacterium]
MSVRTERVGAVVRDALGKQFQRSMPEYLDGLVTVVSVRMSPDLRIAKVYVSIYRSKTDPDLQIKRLNIHTGEIRHRLGDDVEMKHVPELRFFRDDTLDTVERIDELLRNVRKDDEARMGVRSPSANNSSDASNEKGDGDDSDTDVNGADNNREAPPR